MSYHRQMQHVLSQWHRWALPGNYPVFTVVMVIYHYVEIFWRIIVTPEFCIAYMIMKKYYPVKPVNIHIQSLINMIQENNWVITTKKRVRINDHHFVVIENGQLPSMPSGGALGYSGRVLCGLPVDSNHNLMQLVYPHRGTSGQTPQH